MIYFTKRYDYLEQEQDNYIKLKEQGDLYENILDDIKKIDNLVENLEILLSTSLTSERRVNKKKTRESFYQYMLLLNKTKDTSLYPVNQYILNIFNFVLDGIKKISFLRTEIIEQYKLLVSPYNLLINSNMLGTVEYLDSYHSCNYYARIQDLNILGVTIPSMKKYNMIKDMYDKLEKDSWIDNLLSKDYQNIKTKLLDMNTFIQQYS